MDSQLNNFHIYFKKTIKKNLKITEKILNNFLIPGKNNLFSSSIGFYQK